MMALDGKHDSIKAKIEAVREVIPNKSNHELTLVLQYYDYNINEAIAAILEDGASTALKAWNYDKTKIVKKKIKKPANNKTAGGRINGKKNVNDVQDGQDPEKHVDLSKETLGGNKDEQTDANLTVDKLEHEVKIKDSSDSSSVAQVYSRKNSVNEGEPFVGLKENVGGKIGIEKSVKDLGRHWHSLQRTNSLLVEEFEKSEKRLKMSFRELHQLLESREIELTRELAQVKQQAMEVLAGRLDKANDLKVKAAAEDTLSNVELNELRVDIKQFVGDRKLDEELGKTIRFIRNHEKITREIKEYGEISPVKAHYVNRKQSVTSTNSLTQSETTELETPSIPQNMELDLIPVYTSAANDNLCAETAEMHMKLTASLQLQGLSAKSGGQSSYKHRFAHSPSQMASRKDASGARKYFYGNKVFESNAHHSSADRKTPQKEKSITDAKDNHNV